MRYKDRLFVFDLFIDKQASDSILFTSSVLFGKSCVLTSLTLCVQMERQPHPLGSAVQTAARDDGEVSQSERRQVVAADGQREG